MILDNHDDFGGHAKRNEFDLAGHLELMNGGTLGIDSPRPYSAVAEGLLRELGIDVRALSQECEDHEFYPHLGLMQGAFFDRETFGADRLVVGRGKLPVKTWTAAAPLSERAKQDIERVEEGENDYLPDVPAPEKKLRLSRISYSDFLRDLVGVDPSVLAFYQAITHGEWGVGIDAISALDGWAFGLPGFKGLKLPKGAIERMGYTPSGYHETGGSARFHFPDGNASIARLLVRSLVPAAVPGRTAKDVVTARIDYSRLDRPDGPVRVRLSSTAARVRNLGDPSHPEGVEVTYLRTGKPYRVRARDCVLACYNMMIPYLCPELPEAQKVALHKLVKTPLVYTTVALRNWHSFKKLGVYQVYAPGCYMSGFGLNPKVNIGGYRSITDPSQPILVRMLRTPCKPGLSEHEQNKVGRAPSYLSIHGEKGVLDMDQAWNYDGMHLRGAERQRSTDRFAKHRKASIRFRAGGRAFRRLHPQQQRSGVARAKKASRTWSRSRRFTRQPARPSRKRAQETSACCRGTKFAIALRGTEVAGLYTPDRHQSSLRTTPGSTMQNFSV